ncbi:helix-turn-helix domain-containing protein [Myxococcus sp. 1LA]
MARQRARAGQPAGARGGPGGPRHAGAGGLRPAGRRRQRPDALLSRASGEDAPLEEVERAYVRRVVEAQGGNKAAAARILGINRRTLYRKLDLEE